MANENSGAGTRGHEQQRLDMTTIFDVARAAGVSTATVSRVLNNHPQVDPRLAATVRQAVKDLRYRPSLVARSLRTRRNRVWALIISDIRTGPFFGAVVRGVEDVAYEAGYSLFLCNTDEDLAKEASYIELAVAENVGGVILTPSGPRTDLSPLVNFGIPVVLVDRTLPAEQVDSVARRQRFWCLRSGEPPAGRRLQARRVHHGPAHDHDRLPAPGRVPQSPHRGRHGPGRLLGAVADFRELGGQLAMQVGLTRFDGHPPSGAQPRKGCPKWRTWGSSSALVGRSQMSSRQKSSSWCASPATPWEAFRRNLNLPRRPCGNGCDEQTSTRVGATA